MKRIILLLLAAGAVTAFAGTRLETGKTAPVDATPGVWAHARKLIASVPVGEGAWRVTHTGEADWAFNPYPRFDVKPGEVYVFEAACKAAPNAASKRGALLCVALFDAKGAPVDWAWARRGLKPGGKAVSRYLVPEGAAFMQPRIIGDGSFDSVFCDLRFSAEEGIVLPAGADGVLKVSSAVLELGLDRKSGALSVTDRRTGRTWQSQTGRDGAARAMVVESAQTDGGLAVTMLNPQTLDKFKARFTLEKDRPEFIVEVSGEGQLAASLDYPRPFQTKPGDRLVYPHNEGMGFPVEEKHPIGDRYEAWSGSGLCMAFFGVIEDKTGAGWMTILETEADASMRTRRDEAGCISAGPSWDPQLGQFGSARRARYVMLDKGGHVAMCKRYRDYAKSIGRWKPFSEKVKERPILDRLFGAINVWCWEGGKKKWIKDLQEAGIRRILWSGGGSPDEVKALAANPEVLVGRYDIYTDVYHPEQLKKLGWKSGCNREAWPNDVIWSSSDSNDWTRAWGVKAKDGTWTYCATLCDLCSPDYCRRNIAGDLKSKPYNARFLDVTTAGRWKECWNPRHPMNRTQSRAAREKLLSVVSKEYGLVTGGETGHDFSVPFCDYYEGMLSICSYRVPDSGRNIQQIWTNAPERVVKYQVGEKYRLPLWELVFHDCTCAEWYWGDYNNKLPQLWAKRDLFNVLYGTMGMFVVNKTHWQEHKADFVRSYEITSPVARSTAKYEMTNHEILTDDRSVQRTTFANGVKVTVNFGDQPWKDVDGTVVAPRTHRVTGLLAELKVQPRLNFKNSPRGKEWWMDRHNAALAQIKAAGGKFDVVLLGDSIMHYWDHKPYAQPTWNEFTNSYSVLNLGYAGDRTQHVLWRLDHGELDGVQAKVVVVMIGTNNNSDKTTVPANVATGIKAILDRVRTRVPGAKVLLLPIFPRGFGPDDPRHAAARERNEETNRLIREFADGKGIVWLDFNSKLVDPATNWPTRELFPDRIHPGAPGCRIWLDAMKPFFREVCGH